MVNKKAVISSNNELNDEENVLAEMRVALDDLIRHNQTLEDKILHIQQLQEEVDHT